MNIKTKNLIILALILVAISVSGYLYLDQRTQKANTKTSSLLTAQVAAENAINYINEYLLPEGTDASLVSVTESDTIYKIRLKIGENEYDSYITQDGKYLFPEGYDMTENQEEQEQETQTEDVAKADKPDIKLFVMSYCPYGLQAQKMFLPVYDLLKAEANMGVYFVDYIMHDKQEIDENLNQYCIQEESMDKYYNYLSCFVKEGNTEDCILEANIDKNKLSNCINKTDSDYNIYSLYENKETWLNGAYPQFNVNTDLNQQYGVGGSPTVVINGKITQISPRSPENFKEVVCQSFNSPPESCSQVLSSTAFTPGFGLEPGESTSAGCGQ